MLQSKILEIIQRNYNEYKGSNEAELHASEDLADLTLKMAFACSAGYIMAFTRRKLSDDELKELQENVSQVINESLEEISKQKKDEQSNS